MKGNNMKYILIAIGFVLYSSTAKALQLTDKNPNILIIITDDMGAECLGSYGGESYETPNIDKLASEGALFENAYATPICTPTRIQLLTGKYPFQTGWTSNLTKEDPQKYLNPEKHPTFASLLKNNGYRTAVAGKWQLCRFHHRPNHVKECGFDTYSVHTMWDEMNQRTSPYWNPQLLQNGELLSGLDLKFGADIFTDFLIQFMLADNEKPFLAYYPMYLPHDPWIRTPDNLGEYKNLDFHENYAGMIRYADKMVGKLLDALNKNNLLENTIVIFTADNGTNARFVNKWNGQEIKGGKQKLIEQGTRVPFIVYWKDKIQPKTVIDDLIDFTDIYPTLAELVGSKITSDGDFEGISFLSTVLGETGDSRDWVLCQYEDDWFLRNNKWLIRKSGQIEDVSIRYQPKIVEGKVAGSGLKLLQDKANQLNQHIESKYE